MSKGDHIYVRRFGYTHHGIDCGDGTLIHFTGEPGQRKPGASVSRSPIADFGAESRIKIRRYRKRFSNEVAVTRAESQLGAGDYNVLFNNCEHFATWCCTGRNKSKQARNAFAAGVSAGPTQMVAALAAPLAIVTGAAVVLGGYVGIRKARMNSRRP